MVAELLALEVGCDKNCCDLQRFWDLADFAALKFRRQYYHPRTWGKNLVILYMTKIDALNLLVNSDLGNSKSYPVGILLLERMGGRERVNPPPGTPFRADFNELQYFLFRS